eukprot:PhM_4_TR11343/c0_g1_i1/m.55672
MSSSSYQYTSDDFARVQDDIIEAIQRRDKDRTAELEALLAEMESERETYLAQLSQQEQKEARLRVPNDEILICVVYTSQWLEPMTDVEVSSFCGSYSTRNFERGITGMMQCVDGRILCVLQGPEGNVRSLISVIAADRRHTDMHILRCCPTATRTISDFGLKFHSTSADVTDALISVTFGATQSMPYMPKALRDCLLRGGAPQQVQPRTVRASFLAVGLSLAWSAEVTQRVLSVVSEAADRHSASMESVVVQGPVAVMVYPPQRWADTIEAARFIAKHAATTHSVCHVGDVTLAQYTTSFSKTYACTGTVVDEAVKVLALPVVASMPSVLMTKAFVDHTARSVYHHVGFHEISDDKTLSLYVPVDMKR